MKIEILISTLVMAYTLVIQVSNVAFRGTQQILLPSQYMDISDDGLYFVVNDGQEVKVYKFDGSFYTFQSVLAIGAYVFDIEISSVPPYKLAVLTTTIGSAIHQYLHDGSSFQPLGSFTQNHANTMQMSSDGSMLMVGLKTGFINKYQWDFINTQYSHDPVDNSNIFDVGGGKIPGDIYISKNKTIIAISTATRQLYTFFDPLQTGTYSSTFVLHDYSIQSLSADDDWNYLIAASKQTSYILQYNHDTQIYDLVNQYTNFNASSEAQNFRLAASGEFAASLSENYISISTFDKTTKAFSYSSETRIRVDSILHMKMDETGMKIFGVDSAHAFILFRCDIDHCEQCRSPNKCHDNQLISYCMPTFIYNIAEGTCSCDTASGYILNQQDERCYQCTQDNCEICNSSGECTKCKDGFSFYHTGSLVDSTANCVCEGQRSINILGSCISCYVTNCQSCEQPDRCVQCSENYLLSSTNECNSVDGDTVDSNGSDAAIIIGSISLALVVAGIIFAIVVFLIMKKKPSLPVDDIGHKPAEKIQNDSANISIGSEMPRSENQKLNSSEPRTRLKKKRRAPPKEETLEQIQWQDNYNGELKDNYLSNDKQLQFKVEVYDV